MATTGTIKGVCDNKNYTLTCVWNVVSSTETTSTITAKVYLKAPNGWSTFSDYWDCTINGTKVTDNKSTWVKSESVLLGQKTWTVSHSSNGDCSVNISFSYVNGLQSENMNQYTTHQGSGSGVAKINSVSPSKPIQVFTPKKENIILYEENETNFSHNGIYILKPLECIITRNLVDYVYELDMKYPMDDDGYWKAIIEGRIIKANGQLFRIIQTNILVVDSVIEIYAKHVFFDLQKNFIEEVNVKNKKGNVALAELTNGTAYQHNFSFLSESTDSKSFKCVRKNVLDALLGEEDSFVQLWGGELDIDNFNVSFLKQVGSNKGYKIKYGKNLTGLTLKTDHSTVITQIKPTGFDGIGLGQGNYVISSNVNNYCMPIIKEINYEHVKWTGSPNYDKDKNDDEASVYKTLELAQAELRRLASLEFSEKEIDLPSVTCEVNFVELANTEEYHQLKGLETISLGDIVTIEHQPLGINIKARCIGYTYDCLKLQYEEVTIGDYQKGFFRETSNVTQKVTNGDLNIEEKLQSVYVQSVNKMSETMNNAMNGYVVLGNTEILIMDTDNKETAQKVWKFNSSGIAYSSTGYEGKYTVGMTMDGHINGSIITANSIQGGMLELETITARELAVDIQETLNSAMTEESTQALITSNLDMFESNLSKTFITEEEASQQIQNATERAVEQATQEIVDTSVQRAMNSVDDQLSGKLSDFSTNVMNPALQQAMSETLQDSKDYVVEVTGNYYAKQETDSKISQTRESIELGIYNTYETKENTSVKITEAIDGVTIGAINRVFGTVEEKTKEFTGISNDTWVSYDISSDISDKDVIVSFEYDLNATVQNGSMLRFEAYYISTSNQATYDPKYNIISSTSTQTIDIKSQQVSFATKFNAVQQNCQFRFKADGVVGTFTIRKAQIKVGNKITEWSIAPEDIESNANDYTIEQLKSYYTKTQTDSRINIAKEEINLGVSSKYETIKNVETKVQNSLNSAKNYSDSKATEVKNNANKQLTTTIANYYTKDETDSAINIAKEEINLGVSTNHEEIINIKTEVQNITIGGENLLLGTGISKIIKGSNSEGQATSLYYFVDSDKHYCGINNTEITVSFEYSVSSGATGVIKLHTNGIYNTNLGETSALWYALSDSIDVSKYPSAKISKTYTFSNDATKGFTGVKLRMDGFNGTCTISKMKIERGNKASDWSPNPKDIETNANNYTSTQLVNYYNKTETDSKINVAKEEINLGVSSKYETIANVGTKVQNAINSSKSYTNSKSNEAITSANNYTSTQLTSYYTKTETDSRIDIATDSIISTVSKTYTAKTDFDNMAIGGENLIVNSSFEYGFSNWKGSTNIFYLTENNVLGYNQLDLTEQKNYQIATEPIDVSNLVGKELTLSFDYNITDKSQQTNTAIGYIRFFDSEHKDSTAQADSIAHMNCYYPSDYINSTRRTCIKTVTVPTRATYVRVGAYQIQNGNIYYTKFQLEVGNKATAWKPSLQDAYLYTNQTSSQISSELGDLSKIVSDNMGSDSITSAMKVKLISEYQDAIAVYDKLKSMYSALGDTSFNNLPTELTTAKNNLTNVISPLESSINTVSKSGLSNILDKFNIFYSIAEQLTQAISNAITGITKENKSQIEQLTNSINIKISEITTIGDKVNKLYTHFTFASDGMTIKSSQNSTKTVKLDNDSLDFMDNGTVVAQITDKQLLITDAEVKNQMRIGNILIKPSGVGGIMFIYE